MESNTNKTGGRTMDRDARRADYADLTKLIGKLLLLLVMATLALNHGSASSDGAGNSTKLTRPGCLDKCGNVSIPYPFGIVGVGGQKGCFLDGFSVYCYDQVPYFGEDKTLKILGFNLSQGEIRVQKKIGMTCGDETNNTGLFWLGRSGRFAVSYTRNRFTAIGCATVAMIHGANQYNYTSACGSFCSSRDSVDNSTECTGMGCCQISIPPNLRTLRFSFLTIDGMNYSTVTSFSPCSYALVAEEGWFKFNTSYATSTDFGTQYGADGRGVPMVVDWAAGNGSCTEAKKNMESSPICRAMNSECIDAPNGLGYRCVCSQGYDGNPYLDEGCQDINECHSPFKYHCNGECINTNGSYNCSCPSGTHSDDPTKAPCTPSNRPPNIPTAPNQPEQKFLIGIFICFMVLIICIVALVIECQKRKLAKEKKRFFKQNGGQILYQQILSRQVDTVIIFTVEDLKKATNNFDKSREIGTGGHGTVYKGILRDDRVVAVKRSKIMNVVETEEFAQEIIILSQINHKNVVRLLGCCLVVEVPILVYEFIPNGTLFHLIHRDDDKQSVSLDIRLQIAQESAEALAYMHLSVNRPIVHGDVKSLNILLDENYTAKVTDFGASRLLPKDEAQLMTMVQGTLGYLDPEYLQERVLTEKSDVYSFGVVLLELITGKTAIYCAEGSGKPENLSSSFLQAVRENRAHTMFDTSVMGASGMEELFGEVAELASLCLSIKGAERPSMTQVADKLKAIRSAWREVLKRNETELVIDRPGADDSGCHMSPSMYWTARMMVDGDRCRDTR